MANNNEKDVFKMVDKKYTEVRNELDSRFQEYNEFEDLYLAYIDKTKYPFKTTIFDPETFEKIERDVSYIISETTPRGQFIPLPIGDINQQPKVEIMNELFKYQWNHHMAKMYEKMIMSKRASAIFGTNYAKMDWKYIVKNGKVMYDQPTYQNLFIYDCYPDISANDPTNMEFFICDEYVTLDSLMRANEMAKGYKPYKNLDKLKEMSDKGKGKQELGDYRTRFAEINNQDTSQLYDRLLIRKYYDGKKVISIAVDYKVVIQDEKNPFDHGEIPIHILRNYTYPNQLIGISEIYYIKKLQKAINYNLNQRVENVQLMMNPVIKSKESAQRHAHTWKFESGYNWVVDELNDVDVFNVPDVTGNTFLQMQNYFKDSMKNTLGHFDVTTRNDQVQEKTATEVSASFEMQNKRFEVKKKMFDEYMKGVINQWMKLNQQYLSKENVINIVGKGAQKYFRDNVEPTILNGEEVENYAQVTKDVGQLAFSKDDILGEFDFMVDSNGAMMGVDTQAEIQKAQTALEITQQLAPALQQEGSQVSVKSIYEDLMFKLGFEDIDSIIKPMQEQLPVSPDQQMGEQLPPEATGQVPVQPVNPEEQLLNMLNEQTIQ